MNLIKSAISKSHHIIAFLIAVIMTVSILPVTAYADLNSGDTPTIGGNVSVAWRGYNGSTYVGYVGVTNVGNSEYQTYTYYNYKDPATGQVIELPAYCSVPHLPGVRDEYGGSRGQNSPVTYTVKSILTDSDPTAYWIITAGYPYHSLAELGLNNAIEGYAATKAALWAYLGYRPDVYGPHGPGLGGIYQGSDDTDGHVTAAAKAIYQNGMEMASSPIPENKITATNPNDFVFNDGVWEQTVNLSGSAAGYLLSFENMASVPSGTRILSGVDRSEIQLGQVPVGINSIIIQVPGTIDMRPPLSNLKVSAETPAASVFLAASSYTSGQPYIIVAPTQEWSTEIVQFEPWEDEDDPPEEVGFTVYKHEYGTRAPLAGAEFQVFNPNNQSIGTFVTGPSGFVNIPLGVNPPYGNYRVVEVAAPANYYIEPQESEKFILINENNVSSAQLEFVDKRYGALLVKKANGDGRPLEGASITINHPESGTNRTGTTNAAGQILFEDLLPGTWTVLENAAPAGHIIDAVEHIQVVKSLSDNGGVPESIQLINHAKPGLRLVKYDQKTGFSIGGVKFKLEKDGRFIGNYITGEYGWVEILDLEPGTYTITETEVPSGLILDPASQTVELYETDEVISVYFINPENPTLAVLKLDSNSLQPMAGIRFRIRKLDNTYDQDNHYTDAGGRIDLGILDLKPGAYEITEMSVPEGYCIPERLSKTVELVENEDRVIVFDNIKLPKLELYKFNAKTGLPLPGTVFSITAAKDNARYLEWTTGPDGYIRIDDLEPGLYIVKELYVPFGYILDTREHLVELFPGKPALIAIPNDEMPDMEIRKTNIQTGEVVPNAVFTLRKVDSETITTVHTGPTGTVLIEDLDPGVYEVIEKAVPEPYILDSDPQYITLVPNRLHTVQFQNFDKTIVRVWKRDKDTQETLQYAEFSLKEKGSSIIIGEGVTNEEGYIDFPAVGPGWYTITEMAPPPSYLPADETSRDIEIKLGQDLYEVKFDNVKEPGLIIWKYDMITAEKVPDTEFSVAKRDGPVIYEGVTNKSGFIQLQGLDDGWYTITEMAPAPGYLPSDTPSRDVYLEGGKALETGEALEVKFDNIRKPTLIVTKLNGLTYAGIANAMFKIEYEMPNGGIKSLGSFRTNPNGKIVILNAEPGWYIITETLAAPGFSLPSNPVTRKYLSPGENAYSAAETNGHVLGETASESEEASENSESAPISAAGLSAGIDVFSGDDFATLADEDGEMIIDYPLNSLVIKKSDNMTGALLAGADFVVRKVAENISGTSGTVIGTYTTGHSGIIVITGLEPGGYIVEETRAPANYALVENNQQQAWLKPDGTSIVELSFRNDPYGSLTMRKLDRETKEPLAYAEMKITYADGSVVGTSNGIFITDENGLIRIPNLPKSTVVITEVKAPDGYVLEANTQTIEIDYGKSYTVDFYNSKMSGVQIIKLDNVTRKGLKDAGFSVYKMNGELMGNYTTDINGIIIISGLEPGWYKAVETQAPPGYVLDSTPQDFEATSAEFIKLTFSNTPQSGLVITKRDEADGTLLKGVVYDVMRADGQLVTGNMNDGNQPWTENNSQNATASMNGTVPGSFTTDANGRIQINGLDAGLYYIIERKALDGYELDPEVHAVTVTPGKMASLQLTNRQKAGLRLLKVDAATNAPIYNVEFMVFDMNGKVVGTYYTDNNGLIDFSGILSEGRYTIRETRPAAGYYNDDMPRTVEFVSGKITEIVWKNTPQMGQIQIMKLSGDDNEQNGLPAGTPLAGSVFEVYQYKSGNLADRVVSGSDGRAISKPLPLGRYIIKEVQAPQWYRLSTETLDIELEFATQIIKREFLNYSANTGVKIRKTGVYETMPGDTISYTIKEVANTSTVPLTDFYWRDVLPTDAVRLQKIVTGTYSQNLKYKILITTNKGDTRVIADNLSTTQNNVIDCRNVALGLASDEYVTSFSLMFGTVKAGFCQVAAPQIYVTVNKNLPNGYEFANKADVAGKYDSEWISGNAVWVTSVYAPPVKLPRTGY